MSEKRKILTHDEVLELLSEQAKGGSVSASIALERALRTAESRDLDAEWELLTKSADD